MVRRRFPRLFASLSCLALVPLLVVSTYAGDAPVIGDIDVKTGNLIGGTEITLSVSNVATAQGTHVRVGNQLAQILSVVPDTSITFLTPAVPEPSGGAVDVTVRTEDGKATLTDAYTYTPTLRVDVIGSAALGGGLLVEWQTAGLSPEALMTVWVGNPLKIDFVTTLPAYSGLLYEEPKLAFVHALASQGSFLLHFPALPASIVGFPLHLQGLATKEGAHKGSFTNVATFVIP